jgi:hypothetical protein
MLLSLVDSIFVALKAWAIRWFWDVLGRCCPGKMGGVRTFAALCIEVSHADKM